VIAQDWLGGGIGGEISTQTTSRVSTRSNRAIFRRQWWWFRSGYAAGAGRWPTGRGDRDEAEPGERGAAEGGAGADFGGDMLFLFTIPVCA